MTAPIIRRATRDTVDLECAVYQRRAPEWQVLRDVVAGTRTLRAKAATYLPQFTAEVTKDWQARVAGTEVFNGLKATISGMVGMVFRRPPQLGEDVPAVFRDEHWLNIDGAGCAGDVFARRVFTDALTTGLAGILVDYPQAPPDATVADERAGGLRPYWVHVRAEQIVSWRTAPIGGETVLTQVVIRETITEPDGQFAEMDVLQFRVFRLEGSQVLWEVWREQAGSASPVLVSNGVVTNQRRIPFVVVYATDPDAVLDVDPPLRDLAETVLAHFRVRSDHRHSLHKASVPLLAAMGLPEGEQLTIGPNVAISIPNGGDLKYVEHAGTALDATRQELQDLVTEMAAQGLAMLQRETRAAETAEAKRIDKADQDSALAAAARALEDALEQAMVYHAAYTGETAGSITVNRDFQALTLDAGQVTAYSAMVAAGQLSLDTMWDMLRDGAVLPRTFDPEIERERIAQPVTLPPAGASVALSAAATMPDDEDADFELEPEPAAQAPAAVAAPATDPALVAVLERLAAVLERMGQPTAPMLPPAITVESPTVVVDAATPASGPKSITLVRGPDGRIAGATVTSGEASAA